MKEFKLSNNRVLRIIQDNYFNPRRDQDNLGTIFSWHNRYDLADSLDSKIRKSDYSSAKEAIENNTSKENVIILPLYIYEHSGITISTTPFSCPYDSGQFGFITVSKEKLRKEFGCKRITKKTINQAKEILNNEVISYDHYLTGNQYSYVIENDLEEDGYHGPFHGSDLYTNGMMDDVPLDIKEELISLKLK